MNLKNTCREAYRYILERLAIQNAAQKFALHGDQYAIRALRT